MEISPNSKLSESGSMQKLLNLVLKLAKEVDADLVLATDPDADRLGVRVKDKNGEYHEPDRKHVRMPSCKL